MPVLNKRPPKIKQFYLPSTGNKPLEDQLWVKLDLAPIKTADIMTQNDEDNTNTRLAKMLLTRITEWNINDENGAPWPINFQNLCELDADDFRYLTSRQIESDDIELTTEEKKS